MWEELDEADEVLDEVEPSQEALEMCQQDSDGLTKAQKECEVPGLRWKEVIFVEPIKRKTPVEEALTRILTTLHEIGLPVSRIHSDSGTEFISPNMRKLVTRHSIRQTCSAPEEHNSNGRIENVIQRLKSQMRTYLHSEGADLGQWPLATRATAAMWRSKTLRSMGLPIPGVVPFGTKVQVLSRTWLRRLKEQSWTFEGH